QVPKKRHWQYYLNLLCYRDLMLQEHTSISNIDALFGVEEATNEGYTGPLPAIFTSFHFGSYRAVTGVLVHQGIDFVMVINEEINRTEGENIRKTVAHIQEVLGTNVFFDLLIAEAPGAAMKMNAYLQSNVSVAIFTDGNTGVGGAFRKGNGLSKVDFLGKPIQVRRGVAVLSKISRKPIVPIMIPYSESSTMHPVIIFHDPIDNQARQANYVDVAMQKLYGILEEYVREHPDQWQGWLYLHKYLDIASLRTQEDESSTDNLDCPGNTPMAFNQRRFTVFKMDNNGFLFDREKYLTYPVDQATFELLTAFIKTPRTLYEMQYKAGKELVDNLWQRQVIVRG
ncbi:MAG: hypothetical protein AAFN92_15810, partial [Bacteroidota bacterium]